MSNLKEIQKKILGIKDLPTLPVVANELINKIQEEQFSVMEVARIMYKDPVLTAKILRLANSAFYGMRRKIESLNQAMVILGINEIFNLVVGIAVIEATKEAKDGELFKMDDFWEHSIGAGEISRVLARKLNLRFDGADFTSGLLHDIGKVILSQYFPDEFNKALEMSRSKRIPLWESEREIMGTDHTEIGAWLSENWRLPVRIIDVIRDHHKKCSAGKERALVALVRLANTMAKVAGIGCSGDPIRFDIVSDPAWDVLSESAPVIAELDIAQFTFSLDEDIERAREFAKIVRS